MRKIEISQRGRPLGSRFSQWLNFRFVPFLVAMLVKALRMTLRVRREGFEPVADLIARDQRIILTFWHRRLVMTPLAYPFHRKKGGARWRGVAILSSDSRDGERSVAIWRWFGIHAVRGTAADDGAKALVRMIRAVKEGWDFGITPDGPRGPRQKVKPGVLALSRKTSGWIVPVCVAYSRAWELKTWDGMLIPKPFCRAIVRYGVPFQAVDDHAQAPELEAVLNEMERKADARG